ncbi:MAG: hypothetical protein ABT05_08225 [Lautropia sp. SCN 66-9]|nr:MAG: hypothetical protein ABT05_08225 [Lautropia sp. SCN 66-9]
MKAHTLFEIEALAPRVADGPPRSRVQISSKAELSGVIAQFANTGGVALGREIMRQFSARLAQDLAASAAMASASPGAAASSALPASSASSASSASAATAGARQPAEALSAWRLLGMVLRAWWRQLLGKR